MMTPEGRDLNLNLDQVPAWRVLHSHDAQPAKGTSSTKGSKGVLMSSTLVEDQTGKPRFGDSQLLGMVLIAAGAIWLLDVLDVTSLSPVGVLSILLVITGLGMMLSGARRHPAAMLVGFLLITALIGASFYESDVASGNLDSAFEIGPMSSDGAFVGTTTLAPASIDELSSDYSFGFGDVTLDLSEVEFSEGETPLSVRMGAGHLRLIVPRQLAVRGRAEIGAGEVTMFGHLLSGGTGGSSGFDVPPADNQESSMTLVLELKGGFGELEVVRATS